MSQSQFKPKQSTESQHKKRHRTVIGVVKNKEKNCHDTFFHYLLPVYIYTLKFDGNKK
jgi:hypothetical protein